MLIPTLEQLFDRDLNRLKNEIESYTDDADIWRVEKDISNSAGNLCLHLIGNLNAYIGATLGNSGYVRNRELEFSQKNIPAADLISAIENTKLMIASVLNNLPEAALVEKYPLHVLSEKTSTFFFLIHLTTHLNYHLGQVNYHRRMLGDLRFKI